MYPAAGRVLLALDDWPEWAEMGTMEDSMRDKDFLVQDLIELIAHLRAETPGAHPANVSLRRWMSAVAQGREQAAQRLEKLLAEYGVTLEGKSR